MPAPSTSMISEPAPVASRCADCGLATSTLFLYDRLLCGVCADAEDDKRMPAVAA